MNGSKALLVACTAVKKDAKGITSPPRSRPTCPPFGHEWVKNGGSKLAPEECVRGVACTVAFVARANVEETDTRADRAVPA